MAKEKWITYFRSATRIGGVAKQFTKMEGESVSRAWSWQQRPATDEEIAETKAQREHKNRENEAWEAFRNRPEYIAAMAIRNRLEWMTPENHPLDELSGEEWAQLARKLTAAVGKGD
jgi:hypothetical protein